MVYSILYPNLIMSEDKFDTQDFLSNDHWIKIDDHPLCVYLDFILLIILQLIFG